MEGCPAVGLVGLQRWPTSPSACMQQEEQTTHTMLLLMVQSAKWGFRPRTQVGHRDVLAHG